MPTTIAPPPDDASSIPSTRCRQNCSMMPLMPSASSPASFVLHDALGLLMTTDASTAPGPLILPAALAPSQDSTADVSASDAHDAHRLAARFDSERAGPAPSEQRFDHDGSFMAPPPAVVETGSETHAETTTDDPDGHPIIALRSLVPVSGPPVQFLRRVVRPWHDELTPDFW